MRSVTFAKILATACLASATFACAAEPPVASDTQRGATVIHLEKPAYPAEAVAKRLTGHVDVEARVDISGILRDIVVKPDRPETDVFVAAVKAVLPAWRLQPPLVDCFPSDEPVALRFTFSIEETEPDVLVGAMKGFQKGKLVVPEHLKPEVTPRPVFYIGDANTDVAIYAKLQIDPYGKVETVSTTTYPPADSVRTLLRKVSLATYRWQYPRAPEGLTGPRFTCASFHFRPK